MPLQIDLKTAAQIQYAYTDYALNHVMHDTGRSRSGKAVSWSLHKVHEVMVCKVVPVRSSAKSLKGI
jgi:hypothetical protein